MKIIIFLAAMTLLSHIVAADEPKTTADEPKTAADESKELECEFVKTNLTSLAIDIIDDLTNSTEFPDIWPSSSIANLQELLTKPPRRLRSSLADLFKISSNAEEFISYTEANASNVVLNTTDEAINADDWFVTKARDLYLEHNTHSEPESTELCKIFTEARNIVGQYNANVTELTNTLIEQLMGGTEEANIQPIGAIHFQLEELIAQIPTWDYSASPEENIARKTTVENLTMATDAFVGRYNALVDVALGSFTEHVYKSAYATDLKFKELGERLTLLQQSLTPAAVKIERPL